MNLQCLVGHTGFVGSNLALKHSFDRLYNSENVQDAYGTAPDLLVYSGVPAEKYLANQDAAADFAVIENAIENIKKIKPQKIVLISTIDVYEKPSGVDEDALIDKERLQPYGKNRYHLEEWVGENLKKHLIIRLPGLYGSYIKKNFIFDMIHRVPSMLNEEKYSALSEVSSCIRDSYTLQRNGFYKCKALLAAEKTALKEIFLSTGFSSLNFTDSRGLFQFYNLSHLWEHICVAMNHNIPKLNLATEPVRISELYRYIYGSDFHNEIASQPPHYDYRSQYDSLFAGRRGYIFDKAFVMQDIKKFVEAYQ